MRRYLRLKARVAALGIAALAIVVVAGVAVAGPAGSVKTFTGCLMNGDGVIIKVKEGDSPKSACTNGQTLARLSGGDITKIAVTGGLTLTDGGESGDVEINLDSKYSLPQNCSAPNVVAKWNGTAWVCAPDNDTTYGAGTGLALDTGKTPDEFSIASAYRVKNSTDCTSPNFARGFEDDGDIICGSPPSVGSSVYANTQSPLTGKGIISDGAFKNVVSLSLPAGAYSVTAIGEAQGAYDDVAYLLCRIVMPDSTELAYGQTQTPDVSASDPESPNSSLSMFALHSFSEATALTVQCMTHDDGMNASYFGIQAIKLD